MTYLCLSINGVFGQEWRLSYDHFIKDDPNRPPVAGLSVALLEQNFWGDVVGCPDQRVSHVPLLLLPSLPPLKRLKTGQKGLITRLAVKHLHVNRVHRVLAVMITTALAWNCQKYTNKNTITSEIFCRSFCRNSKN